MYGPFSSIPYASFVQSQPLQQALGPLAQADVGGSGIPMTGMPQHSLFSVPQFQPTRSPLHDFSTHKLMYMSLGFGHGGSIFSPSASVYQPKLIPAAGQEMAVRASGISTGLVGDAFKLGLSAYGTGYLFRGLFGTLPALPSVGAHILGGVTGALGAAGRGSVLEAASWLGRGARGAISTAVSAFGLRNLLGLGGVYFAGKMLDAAAGGAKLYGQLGGLSNEVIGDFRGLSGSGLFGIGMGAGATGMAAQSIIGTGVQPFMRTGMLASNFQKLLQSGELLGGTKDARDLVRNFSKATDTIVEIMKAMNVSLDKAGDMFDKIRQMGISSKQAMVQYALNSRTQAGVIGVSADQLLEVGLSGAQTARSMMLFGPGGAALTQGMAAQYAGAFRTGAIGHSLMREVSGGTLDATVAAGNLAGKFMSFLSGQGQYLVAAAYDPTTGGVSPDFVRRLSAGETSIYGNLNEATANISSMGGMRQFVGRRRRLTSQFMEQLSNAPLTAMYHIAKQAAQAVYGSSTDDDVVSFLMEQMGMSEAQAISVVEGSSPSAQRRIREMEELSRRQQKAEDIYTRRTSLSARFERGVSVPFRRFISATLGEPGARLRQYFGERVEEFMQGFSGQVSELGPTMTENIYKDLQAIASRGAGFAASKGSRTLNVLIEGAKMANSGFGAYLSGRMPEVLSANGKIDSSYARTLRIAAGLEDFGPLGTFGAFSGSVRGAMESGSYSDVGSQVRLAKAVMRGRTGSSDTEILGDMLTNIKEFNGSLKSVVKILNEQYKLDLRDNATVTQLVAAIKQKGVVPEVTSALTAAETHALGGEFSASGEISKYLNLGLVGAYSGERSVGGLAKAIRKSATHLFFNGKEPKIRTRAGTRILTPLNRADYSDIAKLVMSPQFRALSANYAPEDIKGLAQGVVNRLINDPGFSALVKEAGPSFEIGLNDIIQGKKTTNAAIATSALSMGSLLANDTFADPREKASFVLGALPLVSGFALRRGTSLSELASRGGISDAFKDVSYLEKVAMSGGESSLEKVAVALSDSNNLTHRSAQDLYGATGAAYIGALDLLLEGGIVGEEEIRDAASFGLTESGYRAAMAELSTIRKYGRDKSGKLTDAAERELRRFAERVKHGFDGDAEKALRLLREAVGGATGNVSASLQQQILKGLTLNAEGDASMSNAAGDLNKAAANLADVVNKLSSVLRNVMPTDTGSGTTMISPK